MEISEKKKKIRKEQERTKRKGNKNNGKNMD